MVLKEKAGHGFKGWMMLNKRILYQTLPEMVTKIGKTNEVVCLDFSVKLLYYMICG